MILYNINVVDYEKTIVPFLKNGVILDSCVLYELFDGLIKTRISKIKLDLLSEFEQINTTFDLFHLKELQKLYITPHILTEICNHIENKYNKYQNYKEIIAEIFPILKDIGEFNVSKYNFLQRVNSKQPILQAGDISIFVIADDFANQKEKIAILTKDKRIKDKYEKLPYVLIMDYRSIAYNMI